jgi:hypothetical protein
MPQKVSANAVIFDTSIKSFYGTTTAHLGTFNVDHGCCKTVDSNANCPTLIGTNAQAIPNRAWMVKLAGFPSSTTAVYGTVPGAVIV